MGEGREKRGRREGGGRREEVERGREGEAREKGERKDGDGREKGGVQIFIYPQSPNRPSPGPEDQPS
jgi:hypothetical protein